MTTTLRNHTSSWYSGCEIFFNLTNLTKTHLVTFTELTSITRTSTSTDPFFNDLYRLDPTFRLNIMSGLLHGSTHEGRSHKILSDINRRPLSTNDE